MATVPPSAAPPRTAETIRADLARTREAAARSIEALGRELVERFDWRVAYERTPWRFTFGALAVGLWLGSLGSASRRLRN
ncbi:MAG: hypothetical protein ACYCWW_09760 [Deltaproteobacteria bacterium]